MTTRHYNIIGGEEVPSTSGAWFEVRNPADTDDVLGEAPASTAADVAAAIDAAHTAFGGWAGMIAPERGKILYRAANLMESQADDWAAALTREEGKTRGEASREVTRSVDLLRYFAGEAHRVGGDMLPADTPNTLLYSLRVPVGVCAIITPWNFPLSIPVWKIAPALVTGNTVVFKPASATPILAIRLVQLLQQAGLPKGVLNIVTGGGGAIGDALVTDRRIEAVSFTGSYTVGHALYQKTAQRITRTHLEMGGKNPIIVAADADLQKAVTIIDGSGFGLTGQACTACSRVIVEAAVAREFTERLTAYAKALKVGPGLADGTQMGPAVSAGQRRTDLEYVEIAQGEGAVVLAGGGSPEGAEHRRGHFVQPTVLGGVRPEMRIAQEEVFGPVVGIIEAADLDEAFAIANGVEYGLSAGIVTNDLRRAIRFAERSEAGMVKVNQGTVGASIQAPFGGFKNSGSGMFREMGSGAIEFFTKVKTVYIDGQ
jgi:acyl-CoA reductase-like NAD-dependent aldehyde dehydrogenase